MDSTYDRIDDRRNLASWEFVPKNYIVKKG